MKSKSCKAKGRDLQNEVRDELRKLAIELGFELGFKLEDDDIVGREMGQRGVDVRMSPEAVRRLGKLLIECKNKERFNAIGDFNKHLATYEGQDGLKILVHTRNARKGKSKQPRLVMLGLQDFIKIYADHLLMKHQRAERAARPTTSTEF